MRGSLCPLIVVVTAVGGACGESAALDATLGRSQAQAIINGAKCDEKTDPTAMAA